MSRLLQLAPLAPMGCPQCAFREPCGGLEQQSFFGCFTGCGSCGVEMGRCDYTCPKKADFWRDMAEVGGINPKPRRLLTNPQGNFPLYVPTLRHGYSRDGAFPSNVVSLNTFEVLNASGGVRESSGGALRERFKVATDARVILVSVNQDKYIESFWKHRNSDSLAAIATLGITAMTTPNFSFFDDAPRLHSFRNMWRIVRCAEDFADAGIAPVLHVNALSSEDWKMWVKILRANPAVRHICKEFQTGLRDQDRASEAMLGLRRLQDDVGRDLHPFVVGGRRMARQFAEHFRDFTILDSVPFFATVKRKLIHLDGATVTQRDNPTEPGAPLDRLLQDNIRAYGKLVELCSTLDVDVPVALDAHDERSSEEEAFT
jgi:hypothetical protein